MDMNDLPIQVLDQLSHYGHCSKDGYWDYKFHLLARPDSIP